MNVTNAFLARLSNEQQALLVRRGLEPISTARTV
jgi:hypothetical protein